VKVLNISILKIVLCISSSSTASVHVLPGVCIQHPKCVLQKHFEVVIVRDSGRDNGEEVGEDLVGDVSFVLTSNELIEQGKCPNELIKDLVFGLLVA
jgi:hypothetical protein